VVPLHDAGGSTVALIDANSGAVTTPYTYDPAEVVGTSGTPKSYPYLYQGMEYDVWTGLYHSMSNYYSPQLTRPLSKVGPTPTHTAAVPARRATSRGLMEEEARIRFLQPPTCKTPG
jgi:hypothetical protein